MKVNFKNRDFKFLELKDQAQPVDFIYPEEDVEEPRQVDVYKLIQILSLYLIARRNPKVSLYAILYAVGYDISYMLNCANKVPDIARSLGVKRADFYWMVAKVKRDFKIRKLS